MVRVNLRVRVMVRDEAEVRVNKVIQTVLHMYRF